MIKVYAKIQMDSFDSWVMLTSKLKNRKHIHFLKEYQIQIRNSEHLYKEILVISKLGETKKLLKTHANKYYLPAKIFMR